MIVPLVKFNKQCRKAMTFYKSCFGGVLKMQTIGESPAAANFPEEMHSLILSSSLNGDEINIMGTDIEDNKVSDKGPISLFINCKDEKEIYLFA